MIANRNKGEISRDPRKGKDNAHITLRDALMAGFAMFSLKDASLLAFDQRRGDPNDNFCTIYGIDRVPCDTQMRSILDPVDPEQLRRLFGDVFGRLQRGKALEPFVYLDGCYLVLLAGTTYFSSGKIHCSSCLEFDGLFAKRHSKTTKEKWFNNQSPQRSCHPRGKATQFCEIVF